MAVSRRRHERRQRLRARGLDTVAVEAAAREGVDDPVIFAAPWSPPARVAGEGHAAQGLGADWRVESPRDGRVAGAEDAGLAERRRRRREERRLQQQAETAAVPTPAAGCSPCSAARPGPPPPPQAGARPTAFEPPSSKLARYVTLRELGRGTFGVASLVRDSERRDLAVLKRVACDSLEDANDALQEVGALGRVRSPRVLSLREHFLDFDPQESRLAVCIITDFCAGGDLGARVHAARSARARFSERCLLEWMSQLAQGLGAIHAEGIIHRDLKPANILLFSAPRTGAACPATSRRHPDFPQAGPDSASPPDLSPAAGAQGQAQHQALSQAVHAELDDVGGGLCICDLGVAAISGKLGAHTVAGSPAYMAPEVSAGGATGLPYGQSADLWSCGVILVELATLRRPRLHQAGGCGAARLREAAQESVRGVRAAGYSMALEQLAADLLQVEASRRPSAEEVAAATQRLLDRRGGKGEGLAAAGQRQAPGAPSPPRPSLPTAASLLSPTGQEGVGAAPRHNRIGHAPAGRGAHGRVGQVAVPSGGGPRARGGACAGAGPMALPASPEFAAPLRGAEGSWLPLLSSVRASRVSIPPGERVHLQVACELVPLGRGATAAWPGSGRETSHGRLAVCTSMLIFIPSHAGEADLGGAREDAIQVPRAPPGREVGTNASVPVSAGGARALPMGEIVEMQVLDRALAAKALSQGARLEPLRARGNVPPSDGAGEGAGGTIYVRAADGSEHALAHVLSVTAVQLAISERIYALGCDVGVWRDRSDGTTGGGDTSFGLGGASAWGTGRGIPEQIFEHGVVGLQDACAIM